MGRKNRRDKDPIFRMFFLLLFNMVGRHEVTALEALRGGEGTIGMV
jgi:hypothetical protein